MKKILFLSLMSLLSVALYASPIDEGRARAIASDFFGGAKVRSALSDVRLVWAGDSFPETAKDLAGPFKTDNALMYIYNSAGNDGFVVVSGETGTRPVIAFSREAGFNMRDMSPGTRGLLDGWCRQIAAVREDRTSSDDSPGTEENIYGNVVKYYQTATWGQNEPYNLEAPEIDGARCVSGCVATALSIIAHYNRYPESGTGVIPEYQYGDGKFTMPANGLGRRYDYDKMLMDYSGEYTEEQGKAVAALMKDIGDAVKMNYGVNESGAYDRDVSSALATYFGYSKDALIVWGNGYSPSEWVSMLKENIDGYGPTYFRGSNQYGGHAFVLDGYTDTDYFSVNFGWNGINNGYFLLPGLDYYQYQAAFLNLKPDPDGTTAYKDYLCLDNVYYEDPQETFYGIMGVSDCYEKNTDFEIMLASISNMGSVQFKGQIKYVLCDSDGSCKADLTEPIDLTLDHNRRRIYGETFRMRVTSDIELGDRVRLYYKGDYSDDWKWMRDMEYVGFSEVVLASSPEQISDNMWLIYSKETRMLEICSSFAIQCSLINPDTGNEMEGKAAPMKYVSFDLSGSPSGDYLLKVASGHDPLELHLVF